MDFPLLLQTISLDHRQLELYIPDPAAVKERYLRGEIAFPYWSQVWPSSLALALFLIRNPQYCSGKDVLELAGGLGLPSITAAAVAHKVVCSDIAPQAIELAQRSAEHQGLENFSTRPIDWNHIPPGIGPDVVLMSDVNYEQLQFDALRSMMDYFLDAGATIILSTPQRLVAKAFIEPLMEICIHNEELRVDQPSGEVAVTVLVLKKTGAGPF